MIALGIRYLCGVSVAADPATQRPEWPPHSGRIFMAMAAAHFETGEESEERAALEWLEQLPSAPSIWASDAYNRTAVECYVPANDVDYALVRRTRQTRTFQKTRPVIDSVFLIWNADPTEAVRSALGRICAKVTRIGHPSSLVQMWVVEPGGEPQPNWKPDNGIAQRRMRVAVSGEIARLESAFNGRAIEHYGQLVDLVEFAKGKEKARLKHALNTQFPEGRPISRRPQLSKWQGYSATDTHVLEEVQLDGPFDPELLILTKREGRVLGLESTIQLTGALRNAVLKTAPQGSQPEWLTGHQTDGKPTAQPHLAFLPLPFVGYQHADGHVMGLAIAVPRHLEVGQYLGPLFFDPESGKAREVKLWRDRKRPSLLEERIWEWDLERETRERPPISLRRETWTGPSATWASVTPVVLHHHPKKSRPEDVERIVREAFESALLPEPEHVQAGPVSVVEGAGHVQEMPFFDAGGEGLCRYHTHVKVRFSSPVVGPIIVGRGRFRGYGLFCPISVEGGAQ